MVKIQIKIPLSGGQHSQFFEYNPEDSWKEIRAQLHKSFGIQGYKFKVAGQITQIQDKIGALPDYTRVEVWFGLQGGSYQEKYPLSQEEEIKETSQWINLQQKRTKIQIRSLIEKQELIIAEDTHLIGSGVLNLTNIKIRKNISLQISSGIEVICLAIQNPDGLIILEKGSKVRINDRGQCKSIDQGSDATAIYTSDEVQIVQMGSVFLTGQQKLLYVQCQELKNFQLFQNFTSSGQTRYKMILNLTDSINLGYNEFVLDIFVGEVVLMAKYIRLKRVLLPRAIDVVLVPTRILTIFDVLIDRFENKLEIRGHDTAQVFLDSCEFRLFNLIIKNLDQLKITQSKFLLGGSPHKIFADRQIWNKNELQSQGPVHLIGTQSLKLYSSNFLIEKDFVLDSQRLIQESSPVKMIGDQLEEDQDIVWNKWSKQCPEETLKNMLQDILEPLLHNVSAKIYSTASTIPKEIAILTCFFSSFEKFGKSITENLNKDNQ